MVAQDESAARPDTARPVVLLVDDQPIIAEAVRRMLAGDADITLHTCNRAADAVARARDVRPTVILQDLVMPELDGFAVLDRLQADAGTRGVPVIVLSTKEDARDKSRAFSVGAADYLVKLPDRIELVARIRAHSRSFLAQVARDDAYRALAALQRDLEAANSELARLSVLDALTGLSNRRGFDTALNDAWRRARRDVTPLSVVLFDVDWFKRYNDRYGHPAGDEVLRKVGAALGGAVRRSGDHAARYGGEEFALILPNTPIEGAMTVAEGACRAVRALAIPHADADATGHVTLSAGVASAMCAEIGAEQLVQQADAALYAAKRAGRNRAAQG
jgi:two-component system chemotaxis family response regulator WspR